MYMTYTLNESSCMVKIFYRNGCFKTKQTGGTWLAHLVERATLDVRVVSLSPTLGGRVLKKKKKKDRCSNENEWTGKKLHFCLPQLNQHIQEHTGADPVLCLARAERLSRAGLTGRRGGRGQWQAHSSFLSCIKFQRVREPQE